ncbi:VOC family protein [Brevibacillus halotolerans]|uniref:VOC family protein n=1 Tax=Brevibacillus TaxID=55080 RepID=UPI00215D3D8F|nr:MULTISPECIES: VOC family protein [Brevibacillus]MCR8964649.1 VOC family protein [Brevibacillus laterosporus]MCZ0836804.1 VOC family protein [Brevibacillus halotolerans]
MSRKYVHHICIQTNTYKESLRFYQEALGFELIQETPHFHQRDFNTWLRLDSFYIELQTGKTGELLDPPNANTQGLVHLCLWVENLDTELQRMKHLGYRLKMKDGQEIYTVENGRLLKLLAPEGTIVELRDNQGI